ncbi:ATP/GTP-binding protein [Rhodococcus sp. NPDC056743]|uniref:ATP/GTP-binding protein n=1 Tax=Rhodococcus sp. NPDC056743 TaxID=3345934 RepID=UPI00366BADE7
MPRRKPMPKQSRRTDSRRGPASDEPRGVLFGGAVVREEPGPGGELYMVRPIPGANATKFYRCPGCDHDIRPSVAHVVTWPSEPGGAAERRHWHTGCWSGRGTRGLTRRWS